jgi:hypothetical protein
MPVMARTTALLGLFLFIGGFFASAFGRIAARVTNDEEAINKYTRIARVGFVVSITGFALLYFISPYME